jgi:hypothetical protein
MMTNGRSKPITTSFVAELMTVSVKMLSSGVGKRGQAQLSGATVPDN